jgi:hypothetical protein
MPDINNAVALGVQTPKPQTTTDIIAPITSLAQLQYMNANAERVKAETGQIGLNTQFAQGKLGALQDYNNRVKGGETPEKALINSGLATYDPQGASATLGNIKGGLELGAVRNYQPGNPASLASGGPEMVGKELSNQKTNVETQKAATEITKEQSLLWGQVGNLMASPEGATPQGRQMAIDLARQKGIPENIIKDFASLPDDKYRLAGQHLQMASMNAEPYLQVSGQAALNKGRAEAATSIQKVGPTESVFMGPAAREAFTGAAPSSGVVGQPSLGNFAPPGNVPSLTPSPAAPAAIPADPAGPTVRNVNAVATPSVGVNVPSVVTDAGKQYGISPEYMARTFQIESGGNPNAYNAQSKAAGPFQFVPSTGAKYLNGKSPFDLAGSADAAARLAADNKAALTQALGRPPTDAELYLAHQQGAAGAAKLLANPNARAGDLVGNSAIAANGGNPNAPASAFTNLWATKFNGGVGKTIPSAAVSPNVTAVPAAVPGVIPGAIAPLAATLQPTPQPQAAPPPAPQTTPANNVAPAPAAPAPTPAAIVAPNGAPPPTGTAADNTRPLTPVVAGMGPSALHEQEQQGAAYGKLPEELDKAAAAAKTTNTTLDEMAAASDGWRMGKWADKEEGIRESLQAVANGLGINTPGLDKPIANYQDFAKLSGNILRQASHETSSRVGVQEMQLISKSLPNPEMSEGGFKQVATQLKGLNDFAIAKQQAAAEWRSNNNNSLGPNKSGKDFQTTWNAQASPAAFIIHRMQQENPAALQNLVSVMMKTPGGPEALKSIRAQMTTANDNGWFGK